LELTDAFCADKKKITTLTCPNVFLSVLRDTPSTVGPYEDITNRLIQPEGGGDPKEENFKEKRKERGTRGRRG